MNFHMAQPIISTGVGTLTLVKNLDLKETPILFTTSLLCPYLGVFYRIQKLSVLIYLCWFSSPCVFPMVRSGEEKTL